MRTRGAAENGRVKTLEQVGRIVHMIGLSSRPLSPREVREIERRALAKIERRYVRT